MCDTIQIIIIIFKKIQLMMMQSEQQLKKICLLVGFGFLADFLSINVYLNRTLLYCSALTIVGVLTIVSIVCEAFWSMALYSATFGFLMGTRITCTYSNVYMALFGLYLLAISYN